MTDFDYDRPGSGPESGGETNVGLLKEKLLSVCPLEGYLGLLCTLKVLGTSVTEYYNRPQMFASQGCAKVIDEEDFNNVR
eukprot:Nk52_evm1s2124 gene=Nk52_evmTU1s2124